MRDALSPICHPQTGIWTAGRIINHQAVPLSEREIKELVDFWNEQKCEDGMKRMGFVQSEMEAK